MVAGCALGVPLESLGVMVFIVTVASLAAAVATWYVVERPALRLKPERALATVALPLPLPETTGAAPTSA